MSGPEWSAKAEETTADGGQCLGSKQEAGQARGPVALSLGGQCPAENEHLPLVAPRAYEKISKLTSGTANPQGLGPPCLLGLNATNSHLALYTGVGPEVCNPQTLPLCSDSFPRNTSLPTPP